VSLLTGDDYPEAVEPHGRENLVPAEGVRDGPVPGGKRRGWVRWPGRRPRSMLIQDAPDPAGDGAEYGAEYDDGGPPYPGNGFFLDPGLGTDGYPPDGYPEDRYPQDRYPDDLIAEVRYPEDRITSDRYPRSGYADSRDHWAGAPDSDAHGYPVPGHDHPAYSGVDVPDPGDPDSGYRGSRYPGSGRLDSGYPGSGHPDPEDLDPGYPESGYPGSGYAESGYPGSGHPESGRPGRGDPESGSPGWPEEESWYRAEGDGFRLPPAPEDDPWAAGDEYEPDLEEDPAGRRRPLLDVLPLRLGFRGADPDGSRRFAGRAQRLGGILVAAASVVAAALYVPSILAADSRSFTGVVSGGIDSLNFGSSGRVGSVRVHLGEAVRQGELLATETGAARTAAVRADRAAITADQANLAALQADGSAAASITAAQAQLARDRARRAADRRKLVATQIVAPGSGTVVAIFGQPGEMVSPAGLRSSGVHAQASPGQQPRFSLLPSGLMASLPAAGMALPVIALRTGSGWQVRLLIPTGTSAVKVGGKVTISVPAAQLTGIKGTITELSPRPVASSGSASHEAVVQVPGRTRIIPLSGMTANVELSSLRLHGRADPGPAPGATADLSRTYASPAHPSPPTGLAPGAAGNLPARGACSACRRPRA
jgi:multidrug efflux pump subunit AcrA (membrane-fusion protein)